MRIRGLGLRNCFREFSGTCAPLSGRNGPPKNPATGNENLSLAKLSQIPAGKFFSIWAFRPAKIWNGFPCFVDCENREEQLSNFWRTTKNESIVLFFIPSWKLLICSPHFFKVRGPFTLVTLSKARALRARSVSERRNNCFQDGAVSSAWLVLLLARKCGPLVWGFLTCSVVICCRQVVLLGAFAHWFSWHQGLTWRQPFPLRFGRLWTCSFQPRSKVPPQ